jgi:hypothetical protein
MLKTFQKCASQMVEIGWDGDLHAWVGCQQIKEEFGLLGMGS